MFIRFSECPEGVPYLIKHCDPEQANDRMVGSPAIRQGRRPVSVRLANNPQGWDIDTRAGEYCPADHWTALRKMIREDGDD